MTLTPAPFLADVAGGPEGGRAYWLTTSDKMRIRAAVWSPEGADRGTVLLFPGRTEYIEKYGDSAGSLADRGYTTVAIDWRGQGLADRMLPDRRLGHVEKFTDFQKDVAAVVDMALALELPRPWHLVGHSMGGAIGLRALFEGLPVASSCFTGPMWGIAMAPAMRPFGEFMTYVGPWIGLRNRIVPTTAIDGYVLSNPFEDNQLTTDPDMFRMMQEQLKTHPDLVLGGPTVNWLSEAVKECRALARKPSPDLPCLTFLGTNERIVDTAAIHRRMAIWPKGRLEMVEGGEHEVLMEPPKIRNRVFDQMVELFQSRTA
jgi:lysophospholipase